MTSKAIEFGEKKLQWVFVSVSHQKWSNFGDIRPRPTFDLL